MFDLYISWGSALYFGIYWIHVSCTFGWPFLHSRGGWINLRLAFLNCTYRVVNQQASKVTNCTYLAWYIHACTLLHLSLSLLILLLFFSHYLSFFSLFFPISLFPTLQRGVKTIFFFFFKEQIKSFLNFNGQITTCLIEIDRSLKSASQCGIYIYIYILNWPWSFVFKQ